MITKIDPRAFNPGPGDALVTADGRRYEVHGQSRADLVQHVRVGYTYTDAAGHNRNGMALRLSTWAGIVRRIIREGGRFEAAK